jgi:hypothetical protein
MLAFIFSVLIPNVTHIYIYSCFNVNMLNSTFLSAENIAAGCTAHVRHFCDYVSHSYACVLTVHWELRWNINEVVKNPWTV